jgi:hypothetical protein
VLIRYAYLLLSLIILWHFSIVKTMGIPYKNLFKKSIDWLCHNLFK